jgi:hypothetical protein
MDAHVNERARLLELIALLLLFAAEYHEEINLNHRADYGVRAHTAGTADQEGIGYYTAWIRLSGSMLTCCGNSLILIYLIWKTKRTQNPEMSALAVVEWLEDNAIVLGDDSLIGDLDPKLYVKTMLDNGFALKRQSVARDNRGVNFLSRYYSPVVWHEDDPEADSNMCDLRRQLSKLHLVKNDNVPAEVHFLQKLMGYLFTDRSTPVFYEILNFVFGAEADLLDMDVEEYLDGDSRWKLAPYLNTHFDAAMPPSEWMVHEAELLKEFDYTRFCDDFQKVVELYWAEKEKENGLVVWDPSQVPRAYAPFCKRYALELERCAHLICVGEFWAQGSDELPPASVQAVIGEEVVGETPVIVHEELPEITPLDGSALVSGDGKPAEARPPTKTGGEAKSAKLEKSKNAGETAKQSKSRPKKKGPGKNPVDNTTRAASSSKRKTKKAQKEAKE